MKAGKWQAGIRRFGVPNMLSVFRLALIPVFVAVFFTEKPGSGILAAVILVTSGLTDVADGFIARHFHMITKLGQILDPLADKLTQAAICVCLAIRLRRPEFDWILVLLVLKEAVMIVAGANIIRKGNEVMPSRWFGKLATVVSYTSMVLIIGGHLPPVFVNLLLWVVLGFMIFSLLMYAPFFFRANRAAAFTREPAGREPGGREESVSAAGGARGREAK